jgi:hypothetical protein
VPIRGAVVLVPFPCDDLSGAKVRPAVCLTEPAIHAQAMANVEQGLRTLFGLA